MTTLFPTGLDNLTNPTSSDNLNTPGVVHSVLHSNVNDALEAIQTKVGVNNSAVTSSLDYLVKNTSSLNPGHTHSITSLSAAGGTANYVMGVNAGATALEYKQLVAGTAISITQGVGSVTIASTAGGGDFSTNTATSVVDEVVLFADTSGKLGKRSTTTGIAKLTSGVLSAAVADTDYLTPTGNGSGLTALNATNIATGTLNAARLPVTATTQGNTFNGASQLVQLNASTQLPAVSGTLLTNLNASNISSGTIADTYLPSSMANKTFTGTTSLTLGSDATGDIFYRNSSGNIARLGIGSTGNVLTVASGLPSWAAGGSGFSWGATASGTSGTGLALTVGNSASAGTIAQEITIGNTQTQQIYGLEINTGSSIYGQGIIIHSGIYNFPLDKTGLSFDSIADGVDIYRDANSVVKTANGRGISYWTAYDNVTVANPTYLFVRDAGGTNINAVMSVGKDNFTGVFVPNADTGPVLHVYNSIPSFTGGTTTLLVENGVTKIAPSTTAYASLNLTAGTAPTTPVAGDMYSTGAGNLSYRSGTETYNLVQPYGITTISIVTSNTTGTIDTMYACDASSGNITITLTTPTRGGTVRVKKTDSSSNTVSVTSPVAIDGDLLPAILTVEDESIDLNYSSATNWLIT